MTDIVDRVTDAADRYRKGHDRPIGHYTVLDAVYGSVVVGIGVAARRRKGLLPDLSVKDVVLTGIATHRLARTIAKDPITSPFRMPFTEYEGTAGPAELHEKVVAKGMGHAIGELLTCPLCLAQWVATGFVAGLIFAPRATRLVAVTFAAVAMSDFLQFAYAGAQKVEG